jgi:hypothetical protein
MTTMTKTALSAEIFDAATLHLSLLNEFIAVVQGKLAETATPFARDSLADLLANLTDQRETYLAFAEPLTTIAAA